MKIYLDNCCYNRPFDDQSDIMVRLEAEAKLFIQGLVKIGKIDLIWSFVLDYENSKNPFPDRKKQISLWRDIAKEDVILTNAIRDSAHNYMGIGLREADASHLASAVFSKADYFITTDKKILRKKIDNIAIVNPIMFVEEYINAI